MVTINKLSGSTSGKKTCIYTLKIKKKLSFSNKKHSWIVSVLMAWLHSYGSVKVVPGINIFKLMDVQYSSTQFDYTILYYLTSKDYVNIIISRGLFP